MRSCSFILASLLVTTTIAGCGGNTPPPNLPVAMEAARQTALARVPGQVQEEELEEKEGRWVYEFDIQPSQATAQRQEVDVDAQTGQVIEVAVDD